MKILAGDFLNNPHKCAMLKLLEVPYHHKMSTEILIMFGSGNKHYRLVLLLGFIDYEENANIRVQLFNIILISKRKPWTFIVKKKRCHHQILRYGS